MDSKVTLQLFIVFVFFHCYYSLLALVGPQDYKFNLT